MQEYILLIVKNKIPFNSYLTLSFFCFISNKVFILKIFGIRMNIFNILFNEQNNNPLFLKKSFSKLNIRNDGLFLKIYFL